MAYKKILAAVEISDEAQKVLSAAQDQASDETDLHLMNIVRPLTHALGGLDSGGFAVTANLEGDMRKHAQEKLNEWAAKMNVPQSAVHVEMGTPAVEIKRCAEEIGADLIVIGTHGQHGLGMLLGSTANGVLHGVGCDVLTNRIR